MTTTMCLSYENLFDLCGGRVGVVDVPCPSCGPARKAPSNRTRKTLRIWNEGDGFITFTCARCGESGYSPDDGSSRQSTPRPRAALVQQQEPVKDKSEIAAFLWDRSLPAPGTIVQTYLR